MKKKATILFFALVIAIGMFAETVTLEPSDDMYTDAEHPGESPVITELWTADFSASGHFERIMIRFDVDDFHNVNLQSATLHLTRFYSCPSGGTTAATFYAIDEVWDEETWNHTQHIAYNSAVSMPYVFSGTGGNAIVDFEVDVTEFIRTWIENDLTNNGFVILANSNQKFSKFYSKEHVNSDYHPTLTLNYEASASQEDEMTPYEVTAMNFPNPFNPQTTISYSIPQDSLVRVDIFDVRGRLVYEMCEGYQSQGQHQVTWDGKNRSGKTAASGVYYYRITTNRGTITRPMVMLK